MDADHSAANWASPSTQALFALSDTSAFARVTSHRAAVPERCSGRCSLPGGDDGGLIARPSERVAGVCRLRQQGRKTEVAAWDLGVILIKVLLIFLTWTRLLPGKKK